MEDTYQQVKEAIAAGKPVYFSGTPCQVAGLYTYLGSRPSNLTTQDIICHGVPSPLVWEKYVNTYQQVEAAEFRNKKYGWHYFSMHIRTPKKNYYKRLDEDFYLKLFLDNTTLRPICYDCPLKKSGSQADITLADCWSMNKITDKVVDTDKGLSLVITNTENGKRCIEKLDSSKKATIIAVESQKALASQSALRESVNSNPKRSEFFERMNREAFPDLMKNWYSTSLMGMLKTKYVFIKTKVRFLLKRK